MKMLIVPTALVAAALAGAAQAQTVRLSDTDYIATARCAGLADGTGADTARFDQTLREQRRGRADHIRDAASSARREAAAWARSHQAAATGELAACR